MRTPRLLLSPVLFLLAALMVSSCAKRSPTEALDPGEGTCEGCHVLGEPAQVEPAFAVAKSFVGSVHGKGGCNACHGGEATPATTAEAHKAIVADPSGSGHRICANCHSEIATLHATSPHGSQSGFLRAIAARTGQDAVSGSALEMFGKSCGKCHASCGKCHVSRAEVGGGGLVAQHAFQPEPDPMENCLACHAERIGAEFTGQIPGNEPDVHYEKGMRCFDCHPKEGFHGDGQRYDRRYDVADLPKCTNCHPDVLSEETDNFYHKLMVKKVQCQVCHSQSYRTCYNCHVARDGSYQLDVPPQADFRIAKNAWQDDRHPWEWVVVRHVPVAPNSYSEWGLDQPEFSSHPTWVYASPHNIRKNTPQNSGCYGPCHTNPDVFLTKDYLEQLVSQGLMSAVEVTANAPVTVEEVP